MYSEDWMLEIKPTTHRDSGRYECQISTTPPTSHVVYLKIAGRIIYSQDIQFSDYFMSQNFRMKLNFFAYLIM